MAYSIREFGYLSTSGAGIGFDFQVIPEPAFVALRQQALERADDEKPLLRPAIRNGRECLQVLNYVGLLQTPDGCRIEILPKTSNETQSPGITRELLWKMLAEVHSIRSVQTHSAELETLNRDWLEILISHALREFSQLVRHGICRDYVRREERSGYLRGQLQVAKQIRLRPGQLDRFCVSYDQYVPDRPENRLLKAAIGRLELWAASLENQRACRELLFMLQEVPASTHVADDFFRWSNSRELAHYRPAKPWVELILGERAPVFSAGGWQGVSLLFPMEKLFEDYVASTLSRHIALPYHLKSQVQSRSLVTHQGKSWFRLKPDLLISHNKKHVAVLDTKWKLLREMDADGSKKYGMSQSDLYQLFAYGQKYLGGSGIVFLIYPAHESFSAPLPVFNFDEHLRLYALPFDLNRDQIASGEWQDQIDWLRSDVLQVA